MSVVQIGKSWKVSISQDGTRYRKSFATQHEGIMWEAEAKVALMQGRIPPGVSSSEGQMCTTLGDLADRVYEQVWSGTRGEVTAEINTQSVIKILGADLPIRQICISHSDLLVNELRRMGNKPATINRKLAALSRMMSFALDRGWIDRKPKIERLRESEGRVRFLSWVEYENIQSDLVMHDPVLRDLVVILVQTGMRLSEALSLKWEDADPSTGHIRVWENKSDRPRSIPMSSAALDVLRRLHDSDEVRVTMGPKVTGPFVQLSLHSVRHKWDAMKERLCLNHDKQFTPHCCRHTFASWLVQKGVPIFTVKELCGHRCIEVTMRYAHLQDSDRSKAITTVFG